MQTVSETYSSSRHPVVEFLQLPPDLRVELMELAHRYLFRVDRWPLDYKQQLQPVWEEFCRRGLVVEEEYHDNYRYHYQYSVFDLFTCFMGIHAPEEGPSCYCDFGLIEEEEFIGEQSLALDEEAFDEWLWHLAKRSYVAFSRSLMRIASATQSDRDG